MDDLESETKCRRYILGWTISLTVSFSGIDAILYYSNTIFENAGLTDWATLITGKKLYFEKIIYLSN